jgi:uncharacterized protein YPO0396
MGFFSQLLVKKVEQDNSEFLYYNTHTKTDIKIHTHILQAGMSDEFKSMSLSRIRTRSGVSLEEAIQLLG